MLIGILLIAFGLRLYNLGAQSLWHDEAWSVFSAYHPLASGGQGTDPNAPPLFYITLGLWQHLVGDGVWAMRCWSALLGLIAVAVTGGVTRRLAGRCAATGAALLAAFSPMLWVYSQEIRAYVVMPLLALILLAQTDQLLRAPTRRTWMWLLLTEISTLYTHNLGVPIVAWLNLTLIAVWVWRRDGRHLRIWLTAQIGLALLYLPWLITQRPTGTPLNTPPSLNLATFWNIWQAYFTGINTLVGADTILIALTAIFGLIAVFALGLVLIRQRTTRTLLVLSQAILIPIFELAIILAAHIDFHPRYFVAGIPAALMLVAIGVAALTPTPLPQGEGLPNARFPLYLRERGQGVRAYLAWGAIALLAAAIGLRAVYMTYSSPIYQHDDFRAIAERYAGLSADDAIIIPYGWEPTLDYYRQKMGFRARVIGIPLHTDTDAILAQLGDSLKNTHHVEVLTWYQLPADLRGLYPCVLSAISAESPDSFTVNGLTTLRYTDPGVIQPAALSSDPISFGTFTVNGTRVLASGASICAITDWTLHQATAESFRVSVRLQNPFGWDFTTSDSDLRDSAGAATSLWKVGAESVAFNLLKLPIGTPKASYLLTVGIYSPTRPGGLTISKNGAVAGTVATVGAVSVPDIAATSDLFAGATPFLPHLRYQCDPGTCQSRLAACTLAPGQPFRVTLLWLSDGIPVDTPPVITLRGTNWEQHVSATLSSDQRVLLNWYSFTVPADATGHTQLMVSASGKTEVIQDCTISGFDHIYTEPTIQNPVGAAFFGVGTLVGVELDKTQIDLGKPFTLTLYWKARFTTSVNYKVFTHLLDANGQVIAQNDSPPVNGDRPTTGWLNGEYIRDPHMLMFIRSDYTGAATLEMGLYDPASGGRVTLSDGSDHVTLPIQVSVR